MRRVATLFRIDDENPLNGWHVLTMVVLFFGVIITVNMVMAVFATGTFPGLVVKNSYVASQNYNALLAESRAQAERGWMADLAADDGILTLRLADSGGAPISGVQVEARVGRPASAAEDRMVVLHPAADGYAAREPLASGRWIVELTVHSDEALVYRDTRPIHVLASEQ